MVNILSLSVSIIFSGGMPVHAVYHPWLISYPSPSPSFFPVVCPSTPLQHGRYHPQLLHLSTSYPPHPQSLLQPHLLHPSTAPILLLKMVTPSISIQQHDSNQIHVHISQFLAESFQSLHVIHSLYPLTHALIAIYH